MLFVPAAKAGTQNTGEFDSAGRKHARKPGQLGAVDWPGGYEAWTWAGRASEADLHVRDSEA